MPPSSIKASLVLALVSWTAWAQAAETDALRLYDRARARYDIGENAAAVKDLTASLNSNKSFAPAFSLLGAALLRQGDLTRAMKAYDKALALDAHDIAPRLGRAKIKWRQGDSPGALEECRRALASPKLTADGALAVGDVLASLESWSEARNAYQKARELGADPLVVLARRAAVSKTAKDEAAALGDLDAALRINPRSALALTARALLHARSARPALALKDFNAAISADPSHAAAYDGRGEHFENAGADVRSAMRDYSIAVKLRPREPRFHAHLGSLRLQFRLFRKAVESYDAAIALQGRESLLLERRAEAKFLLGDREGAQRDIDDAIRENPTSAQLHEALGLMRLREHDFERAVSAFNEAIKQNGRLVSAYVHRGLAFGRSGQLLRAQENFIAATRIEPKSIDAWTNLCQARRLASDAEEALEACDRALTLDGEHGPAYLQRSLVHLALNHHANAVADAERTWSLGIRRPEASLSKAIALAAMGRFREAHRAYLQAAELDPKAWSVHLGFGAEQSSDTKFASAIKSLEAVKKANPSDPYAFVLRGDGLLSDQQYEKAAAAFARALELDATLIDARVGRGTAFASWGRFEEAQSEFSRALARDPGNSEARVQLALALQRKGDTRAALKELDAVIRADSRNAQAYLHAAHAHTQLKEYWKAVALYHRAAKHAPLNAEALGGLGAGYLALKRYADALDSFSGAIALDGRNNRYRRNRGEVWSMMGRFTNAAADFRTASLNTVNPSEYEEYTELLQKAETSSGQAKSS
ncbi:MAG: tetratricopeptide repeat protein [Elusimicrobiota bacterium]